MYPIDNGQWFYLSFNRAGAKAVRRFSRKSVLSALD